MKGRAPHLAALLGVCLALVLSVPAQAAEALAAPEGCVAYAVAGGSLYFDPATGTVRDCDATVTQADVPARIGGVDVTDIGDGAFDDCPALTAVTLPQGVTYIGDDAFRSCAALERVTIPGGVTGIGPQAFQNCSALADLTLPDTLTYIGYNAFDDCSALNNLTIPGSVETIGECAFRDCTGLRELIIREGVTTIGQGAFSGCLSLTDVTIPGSVRVIEDNTFDNCWDLTHVTIQPGVTAIEYDAFYNCSSLTDVDIPDTVTFIGSDAFEGCSLGVLAIPGSVTSLADRALENCGAAWIVFGHGVTELPDRCLNGTGAATVCIPSTVTAVSQTYTDAPDALTVYAVPGSPAWTDTSPAQRYPMTQAPGDFLANLSPRNALACLSVLDQDMLSDLLLTDDTLAQGLAALEQALGGAATVSMTPDCALSGQPVAAIGGRLWAADPQGAQAVLTLGPASAPAPAVPGQHPYSRFFSVAAEGLTPRVPMRLTLELPENMDPQDLMVLHIREDAAPQDLDFMYQDGLLRFCAREPGDYYVAQRGYDLVLTQAAPRSVAARVHVPSPASLLWAAYDGQSQMLDCGLVPLAAQEGWTDRTFDVPQGTARVKGFLLDPETAVPRVLPQALILQ